MENEQKKMVFSLEEWRAEGERRFGGDEMAWKWKCPSCGHVASAQDWQDAGAPVGAVAFSCVGRWKGGRPAKTFRRSGGPCDYAGGGLICINPVIVTVDGHERLNIFEFAESAEKEDIQPQDQVSERA